MKAPQSFKMLGTVCPTMQHSSSSSSSNCSSSSRGDGGGGVGQKLKKNLSLVSFDVRLN